MCSFKKDQNNNFLVFFLLQVGAWHVGKTPDPRAIETMKKHDLPYNNKARQIKPDDFKKFDYIFGMDVDNMEDLVSLKPKDGTAKLLMLGEFDPQGDKIIRDPYYVSLFH